MSKKAKTSHYIIKGITVVAALLAALLLIAPFVASDIVSSASMNIFDGWDIGLKNAPADTHKRPIVSKKRRHTYKLISTIVAIAMVIVAVVTENQFISNSLIFALVVQNFMISPTVYHIFKLPYANYKNYVVDIA